MSTKRFDKVIIGAGLYGLYAALHCGKRGEHVAVIECDPEPFSRATYINQARVHMGYHYPRSLATATKSAHYFKRFVNDFGFCIKTDFEQVYATSNHFSWTNMKEFSTFCRNAGIRCDEMPASRYFKDGMCDGAFLTTEYTYDAKALRDWLLNEISKIPTIEIDYNCRPNSIVAHDRLWTICTKTMRLETPFVLNATYAGVNNIHKLFGAEVFDIKYELCEIILCKANGPLSNVGLTVMDGPFFSIMPFGLTGLHSLTSVTFTPHDTSYNSQPSFSCQSLSSGYCTPENLGNCNLCPAKPSTAWPYMSALAKKYIRDDFGFSYKKSLFSMKPILKASEIDDSRPTVIRVLSQAPTLVSVLSGKINTVYDLDDYLDDKMPLEAI